MPPLPANSRPPAAAAAGTAGAAAVECRGENRYTGGGSPPTPRRAAAALEAPAVLLLLLGVVAAVSAAVASLVNSVVPRPYMDEIFHVPQAQTYCRGEWSSWDDMITTFPGLYYVAVAYARVLRMLLPHTLVASAAAAASDTPLQLNGEEGEDRDGHGTTDVDGSVQGEEGEELCPTALLRSLNLCLFLLSIFVFFSAAKAAAVDVRRLRRARRRREEDSPLREEGEATSHIGHVPPNGKGLNEGNEVEDEEGEEEVELEEAVWKAAMFALHPLHWFFSFLFYTDVGSTAAVLLMHLCCLRRRYLLCALSAGAAVLMRQTNAVWAAFCLFLSALSLCQVGPIYPTTSCHEGSSNSSSTTTTTCGGGGVHGGSSRSSNSRSSCATSSGAAQGADVGTATAATECGDHVVGSLLLLLQRAWQRKWTLLLRLSPLLSVVVAFAAFVFINGGIVLGAKDAHKFAPHLMQPLYCAAFAALSFAPLHFSPANVYALLAHVSACARARPRTAAAAAAASVAGTFVAVKYFSLAHPYLLADNRHYTFYLWRRVINSTPLSRFALIPLYLFASWSLLFNLGQGVPSLWALAFAGVTCVVLVPSPLIELRYFSVPMVVLLLHTPLPRQQLERHRQPWLQHNGQGSTAAPLQRWKPLMVLLSFAAVNATTMFLFLFRPFHWTHDKNVAKVAQRFMW